MPHIASVLARQTQTHHLVVAPERTVDENAGRQTQMLPHRIAHRAEPRRIEHRSLRRLVAKKEAGVVPDHGSLAMRREGRRFALERHGTPRDADRAVDGETGAIERDRMSLDTAVMTQHFEYGMRPRQIAVDRIGAPNRTDRKRTRLNCSH